MAEAHTALVTGATGAIGPALVNGLLEQGFRVRVLARQTPPQGLFSGTVDVVQGAITDPATVRLAVRDVELVFHLAALLHVDNPGPEMRGAYESINVEGTRCLVQAAQEARAGRFIFFSTINVYGPSQQGQLLDEASPIRPDSWYAETKAKAEEIVLGSMPAVVLRLASVYGPGMKGNYPRLVAALHRGRFLSIGAGRNRRTMVYIGDMCAAATLAATHRDATGQVYNVTDGQVHTMREILEAICAAGNRRPPRFHLPATPIRLVAGLLEDGARLVGAKAPVSRSTVRRLVEDVAVSGARIQRDLGFQPAYDLAAGWRETVHALRLT